MQPMRGLKTVRLTMDQTTNLDAGAIGGFYSKWGNEFDGVPGAVPQFTKVEGYTTFLAEYADVNGSFVIHFFPPREAYVTTSSGIKVSQDYLLWWQRRFPEVLSPTAEEHFKTTYPTLAAQYIPEMQSWWMRAGGFAKRLGASDFVEAFFALLDQRLDAASSASVGST